VRVYQFRHFGFNVIFYLTSLRACPPKLKRRWVYQFRHFGFNVIFYLTSFARLPTEAKAQVSLPVPPLWL
jgi:hypothetical protein